VQIVNILCLIIQDDQIDDSFFDSAFLKKSLDGLPIASYEGGNGVNEMILDSVFIARQL